MQLSRRFVSDDSGPLMISRRLQGQELQALRQKPGFGRIIYCGDGANDLCPALTLGPDDYVRALSCLDVHCKLIQMLLQD